MNLIERYIDEVGKHLPNKTRADIQAEIRSTLEDMLEDRAETFGQAIDDSMRKDVLAKYGDPKKVAASYLPVRYLIGPKLFPFFSMVLKIVFSVLSGVALFGLAVRYGSGPMTAPAFAAIFGKTLLEYLGGLMSAFGNIVIVFAILQRTLPADALEDRESEKEWEPADLEKEPEPDEVSIATPIWAIVFTVAGLLMLNFYPQIIGIYFVQDGTWTFIPILNGAFLSFLPAIDALWLLNIVLNIFLLRQGRWTPATRWFEVALSLGSIVIAILLLRSPALQALDLPTLTRVFQNPVTAETMLKLFSFPLPIALVVIVIVESIETVLSVYRLLFIKKTTSPLAIN